MSPRSRGRPPGRGRPRRSAHQSAAATATPPGVLYPITDDVTAGPDLPDNYWFDDPVVGEQRSWVMPAGHGSFRGLDVELLDPDDEDELTMLIEAQHPEFADALLTGDEVVGDRGPVNPRLHVALHHIVANQLLANDPPDTWPTVQRLARLGYDWHNIMHMIAGVVSGDIYTAMAEWLPFDAADHARRLQQLPATGQCRTSPEPSRTRHERATAR